MVFVSGLVVGAIVGFIAGMFAVAGSDRDEHEIRRTGGGE